MPQLTSQLLTEVKERILHAVRTEKIILFGSYAWGTPGEGSDIDLFILSNEPEAAKKAA